MMWPLSKRAGFFVAASAAVFVVAFIAAPRMSRAFHAPQCGGGGCGITASVWTSASGGTAPLRISLVGDAWTRQAYNGNFDMRLHCDIGPYQRRCVTRGGSCSTSCTYNSAGSYRVRNNSTIDGHFGVPGFYDSDGYWITVSAPAPPPPPPPPPSWSVTLAATPGQGLTPHTATLTGTGSGTATGGIRWQFDCTNDGLFEYDFTNTTNPESRPCTYPSAGTYTARVQSTRRGLVRSATTPITVSDPPSGAVDGADCTAGLTGWARDADDTSIALTYQVYRDGTLPACGAACLAGSGTANEPGNGPGNHRFTWLIPAVLRDGAPHTYYVYARDSLIAAWQVLNPAGTPLTCYMPPVVSISATPPGTLAFGGSANIIWSTTNPTGTTCTATAGSSSWPGAKATSGSESSGPLSLTTVFTLTCANPAGSDTTSATVTVAAPPPPVVTVTGHEFCSAGPGGTVNWSYVSAVPQAEYQLQVASDPAFAVIEYDSGRLPGITGAATTSQGQPGTTGPGLPYWTRVKAWDSVGTESAWSVPYGFSHPPRTSFRLTPAIPVANQSFGGSDTSNYGAAAPSAWLWDMGDTTMYSGSPGITHTYATPGSHTLSLTVTDSNTQSCTVSRSVNVNQPIPEFKEVLPQ